MTGVYRAVLFSAVVVVAVAGGFMLSAPDRPGRADGGKLLAASLPDLGGVEQNFGQWRGKVIVVNFWATWCPPCLEEIPHFVRMQQRFGDDGLQFVGIAIDEAEKVRRFVKQQAVNYPVVVGQLDAIELSKAMGNARGGLPYTLILDRSGQVVSQHYGGLTEELLTPIVSEYL